MLCSGTKVVSSVRTESALHFVLVPCSSKLRALTLLVAASEEDPSTQYGIAIPVQDSVRALSESAGIVVVNK